MKGTYDVYKEQILARGLDEKETNKIINMLNNETDHRSINKAFLDALGEKKGIVRYADTTLPMDESLILSAVDISGRNTLVYDAECPTAKVGNFDTELAEEFFEAFVREAKVTLHIKKLYGKNSHHIIEGVFKSVAHTLFKATRIDPLIEGQIPSTKGVL